MSTILVAAIVVGSVAGICIFLISIHNKHKREAMNNLLKQFSRSGTEYNLSFSSQEVLNNCVLGLDGMNRKILVVTKEDNHYTSMVIDLNEVKTCTVKKIYGTIIADTFKKEKPEQYLQQIVLRFDLDSKPPVEIVFYKNSENHIYESTDLERKARHWETILSKMKTSLKIA
jgi:hypothetical protein